MSSTSGHNPGAGTEEADYYRILGVPYTASRQEITRAYRGAMKRAHPDRTSPSRRAAAEERAKGLNQAYAVLSKAESRRRYDLTIKENVVQDQIMRSYFGGFNVPGESAHDPFAEALRREKTDYEKAEDRQAHRSAVVSILLAFGGITLIVLAILIAWGLIASALQALF